MTQPRTIAQRYVLESKLGSGGMGTVWKAKDLLLDRTVAVKLLHEGLAEDAAFAERFRREARSAASLGHPNVVAVYDTGTDGVPFIVMEYIEGESLHRLLNRQGPLPVEDTARIGRSVLGALAQAHSRGLVHRDMKPANVLFDANSGEAKVVDFGIAKGLDDTGGLTRTSGLIGTAAYLSPEQVNGSPATERSDLYAVGCLLYACLAGEAPFGGSTPVAIAMRHLQDPVPPLRERRPDVDPAFEAVIMRALEKDPAKRYQSAQEMDAAIAATGLDSMPARLPQVLDVTLPASTVAMRDHPVGAYSPAGTEVLERSKPPGIGSNRVLAAVTAFLVVAAAAAVLVLYLQNRKTPGDLNLAPLPTATALIESATPVPSPTTSTPTEQPGGVATERPCIDVPGLQLRCPSNQPATPAPSPSASPGSSPTATP